MGAFHAPRVRKEIKFCRLNRPNPWTGFADTPAQQLDRSYNSLHPRTRTSCGPAPQALCPALRIQPIDLGLHEDDPVASRLTPALLKADGGQHHPARL
jgi:hypothetical protein